MKRKALTAHLVGLHSYTAGKDIRPAAGAHIAAHQESTFGVILEPDATGSYSWKGLRVYYHGTSTVIPTGLGILGSNNPKVQCKAPKPVVNQSDLRVK